MAQWTRFAGQAAAALEQAAASRFRTRLTQGVAALDLEDAIRTLGQAASIVYTLAVLGPAFQPSAARVAEAAATFAEGLRANEKLASDLEWRYLAWACSVAGSPRSEVFGLPEVLASPAASASVWNHLLSLVEASASQRPPGSRLLTREPLPLVWLPGWLADEEVQELLCATEAPGIWQPSPLALPMGQTPLRTSDSTVLEPECLTPAAANVVTHVALRAAALVGLPVSHVEPLQLVRYSPGQQYLPHVDWGNVGDTSLWVVGQRVATVLVYLSDVPVGFKGGCTRFPRLVADGLDGVRVQPQRGAAVAWPNVNANGAPLFESEHEAEPVDPAPAMNLDARPSLCPAIQPVKVAMNIWIRDRPAPWAC